MPDDLDAIIKAASQNPAVLRALLRTDAITVGSSDLPYDPYRNHGKFAPGPKKVKPKVGRPVAAAKLAVPKPKKAAASPKTPKPKRAKFDDAPHKAKIAEHKAKEVHHRTESLKIVAQQKAIRGAAKGLAKSDKAGRAALKAQHVELGKQRDEHKAHATKARTDRIAASKAMQEAKRQHTAEQKTVALQAKSSSTTAKSASSAKGPTPKSIHEMVANDPKRELLSQIERYQGPPESAHLLEGYQYSKVAQAAIRDHHNEVFAAYGMHNNDAGKPASHTVQVRTQEGMGGDVLGLHWNNTGQIAMPANQAGYLQKHSTLNGAELKKLGKDYLSGNQNAHDTLDAYVTSTHEALHGHGPDLYNSAGRSMIDELTTEMSAWKVAADVHGIHVHDIDGSYKNYINPVVEKLSQLSGKSNRDATAALADASIWHKKRSDIDLAPHIAMRDVAQRASVTLGIHDPAVHEALTTHMMRVALAE